MKKRASSHQPPEVTPALLFDLDGTLIDSVYQHVLAWREALERVGTELSVWRIHRRIGMSGGLLINALVRETGGTLTQKDASNIQKWHAEAYAKFSSRVRPLPGAVELLTLLSKLKIPHLIATSGLEESARPSLKLLEIGPDVPVITRDQVRRAKPDPDLFLAAAESLGVSIYNAIVIGDSVWDLLAARRARALGVGLLSGGYGQEELERAGAYRTYEDPLDLLHHLDEIGVRTKNQYQ
jgi:HAD superfamily hydrolase (TIGR01549 family)